MNSSPVRFHPTTIMDAILEVTNGATLIQARAAVSAVTASPPRGKAKHQPVGTLTEAREVLAAGGLQCLGLQTFERSVRFS